MGYTQLGHLSASSLPHVEAGKLILYDVKNGPVELQVESFDTIGGSRPGKETLSLVEFEFKRRKTTLVSLSTSFSLSQSLSLSFRPSLCCFQKQKLVITIKRPYYIANFLEKSVFYRAGPPLHTHMYTHTHTHTLLATRHRNRSEAGERGLNSEHVHVPVHPNALRSGGERVIKESLYRERLSTHPTHPA